MAQSYPANTKVELPFASRPQIPRSELFIFLTWKHERALALIMHFNRTYHKGCHEPVIILKGSEAEKGMEEERSGI